MLGGKKKEMVILEVLKVIMSITAEIMPGSFITL